MATSYANTGGTGDRSALITVTTDANFDGATPAKLVNGAFGNNTTDSCFFAAASNANGVYIRFYFGGLSKVIDEATWYQNGTSGQGTWKWQGSNDASSWTDLSVGFTLDAGSGGAVIGDLSANTTGYLYYQIVKTGGTTNDTPWLQEIEFKIDDATPSDTEIPASIHFLGITQASALQIAREIGATSPALGLTMAATFTNSVLFTVAASLGYDADVTTDTPIVFDVDFDLGFSVPVATMGLNVFIPATTPGLGVTMAATLTRQASLAAAMALGLAVVTGLENTTHSRRPIIIICQ